MQNAAGVWSDVTIEILKLGIASKQVDGNNCADPTPNAILRIERPRTTTAAAGGGTNCGSTSGSIRDMRRREEFSPLVLFDTREGELRDQTDDNDADPLRRRHVLHRARREESLALVRRARSARLGSQALNVNGYTVYFSDRRGNHNAAGAETGEYGNEDIVNPASATGTPNGVLDMGEDFNGNGTLETYGATAQQPHAAPGGAVIPWGGAAGVQAPFAANITPNTLMSGNMPGTGPARWAQMAIAERNPPMFFRRALKLTQRRSGQHRRARPDHRVREPGVRAGQLERQRRRLRRSSRRDGGARRRGHAALEQLERPQLVHDPYDMGSRAAATTWYRLAVIAGKGINFPSSTRSPTGTTAPTAARTTSCATSRTGADRR